MSVKDLSTFLSRFFVIGFYLPTFFGAIAFGLAVRRSWLPGFMQLTDEKGHLLDQPLAGHLVRIAVLALPLALVLNGIWMKVFRLFRGIPFFGLDARLAGRPRLQALMLRGQQKAWDKLWAESLSNDPWVRSAAALKLLERFSTARDRVQPTRFGNAVRAYEEYGGERWGMDYATVWPRVEALLNTQEQALHDDARTGLAFAANLSLVVVVVGAVRLVGQLWPFDLDGYDALSDLGIFVAGYLVYRLLSVDAVVAVGRRIRASLDLHRLELYRQLAAREVETFTADERDLAAAVSTYLLYGPTRLRGSIGRKPGGEELQ